MILNIKGRAIPVPSPSTIRPINKNSKLGAQAPIIKPLKYNKLAAINSFFVLKCAFKFADKGTMIEIVNK